MSEAMVGGVKRQYAARDLFYGLRYGYPICCVLRFTIGTLLHPQLPQAEQRGVRWHHRKDSVHVPCGILHHGRPL